MEPSASPQCAGSRIWHNRAPERSAAPAPECICPAYVQVPNLPPTDEALDVFGSRDVVGLNRAPNERLSDQADLIRYHADPPDRRPVRMTIRSVGLGGHRPAGLSYG